MTTETDSRNVGGTCERCGNPFGGCNCKPTTDSSERAKPDVSAVMDAVRDAMATWDIAGDYPPIESTWLVQLAVIAACEAWAAVKLTYTQQLLDEGHESVRLLSAERDAAQERYERAKEDREILLHSRELMMEDRDAAQQDADALAEALRGLRQRSGRAWAQGWKPQIEAAVAALAAHDARKG